MPSTDTSSTLDADEIDRFRSLAQRWWDEQGPMRPLHAINPLRLDYICRQWRRLQAGGLQEGGPQTQPPKKQPTQPPADEHRPLAGVEALDIGCGGGLVAEKLCLQGAQVLGIDAAAELIAVAKAHAADRLPTLQYRAATAESLLPEAAASRDLVCCLEVIEHVAHPQQLVHSCADLLRPGGMAVFSTINRTPAAFVAAIVGAEYLLGLLPRGTHRYHKLVRPSELARWARNAGLQSVDVQGMGYNPLTHRPYLTSSPAVNYLATFRRPIA